MPNDPPRLDRTSLARIGLELQAAYHRSPKEPLSEIQREVLLQWAVKEALEAAQTDPSTHRKGEAAGAPPPWEAPRTPQAIATAPRTLDEGAAPILLLLYAPQHGGRPTGLWAAGRGRPHLGPEATLDPTHWPPPALGPEAGHAGAPAAPPLCTGG